MNSDFKELLQLLSEEDVEYLVGGGYAVIYSQPRFTKGLDIWLRPSPENAKRVMRVFQRFGLPLVEDAIGKRSNLISPAVSFSSPPPISRPSRHG